MKNFLTQFDTPVDTNKLARRLSKDEGMTWYCLKHTKRSPVCVSEYDLDRYIKLGFTVECSYTDGIRSKVRG